MNDILDRICAVTKHAANSVATEVNVAAEEQKIREAYQLLGKLYFQAKRAGREPEGLEFADQCRKIEARLKHIKEMRSRKDVTGYAFDEDFEDLG